MNLFDRKNEYKLLSKIHETNRGYEKRLKARLRNGVGKI